MRVQLVIAATILSYSSDMNILPLPPKMVSQTMTSIRLRLITSLIFQKPLKWSSLFSS